MIVTITLNPCIDESSKVEQLLPDAKLRCSQLVYEPGGGGINVSKALKKLELEAMALFPAGGHNGNMLCSLVKEEGILFHAIDTKAETRENWMIMETSSDKQYRFTFPGLPVEEDVITKMLGQLETLSPSFVVASGSLPPGLSATSYVSILEKTRAIGAKCIVDTSGPALQALKGQQAFLIKPNIGELCKLLRIDRLEKDEVPAAAHRVIEEGYASIIVVSMGATGAWIISDKEEFFCAAPVVERRSTVGAGDSMLAGMVYMLQKNTSLEETVRFGVACGTAATMNEGTQLFNSADAFKLFNEMESKT